MPVKSTTGLLALTLALTALESKPVQVRYAGQETRIQAKAGQIYELGPDLKTIRN